MAVLMVWSGCGSSSNETKFNPGRPDSGTPDATLDGAKGGAAGQAGAAGQTQGGAAGQAGSGQGGGPAGSGGDPPDANTPDVDFSYDAPIQDVGIEACATANVEAKLKPLDMYFMMDRSGSMSGTGWTDLKTAVNTFFNAPGSAGITIAMNFFPFDNSYDPLDPACSGNVYVTPLVSWGLLPGHAAALAAGLNATSPTGMTPTEEALRGTLKGSFQRQLQEPGHVVVAVIVSDGAPTVECDTSNGALKNLAQQYYNNSPSIRSFALYVATSASASMTEIAQGGGTAQAYDATNTQNFINALQAIQGSAIPCDFDMPKPDAGLVDPNEVSLKWGTTPLEHQDNATLCGNGGWYYDNNANPTKIILCPSTCNAIKSDPNAKVDVSLGCLGS